MVITLISMVIALRYFILKKMPLPLPNVQQQHLCEEGKFIEMQEKIFWSVYKLCYTLNVGHVI